jgi:hypothetical protein
MAGVKDAELLRARGFPLGVNNIAPEHDFPVDENGTVQAVREAVNVDLVGPSRKPRLREGYTQKIAGRFHSPVEFNGRMLAVQEGMLTAFDATLTPQAIRDVGDRYCAYAQINDDLYWSNGFEFRRIRGRDMIDTPGWIESPSVPSATAVADGGLDAGDYRVALAWIDADGRESGVRNLAYASVDTGGGIELSGFGPAPEGAAKARIYLSAANGDELWLARELLFVPNSIQLGAVDQQTGGKTLETLWLQPLPPCEVLRAWNGRLLGVTGNLLVWSEALRFGLMANKNYVRVGREITLMEPVGDGGDSAGIYVADHDKTYWFGGTDPKRWSRIGVSDHAAIPGTSLRVRGKNIGLDTDADVAVWISSDGVFTAGLPGGQLIDLTRGQLAMPEGERGAMLFREGKGLSQLIASYMATETVNSLAITDHMSVTVTRHKPTR